MNACDYNMHIMIHALHMHPTKLIMNVTHLSVYVDVSYFICIVINSIINIIIHTTNPTCVV